MLTQLKHIGLSDNEAKVYLAMLELGPCSVLEIAAKAGINRPTAYVQIESLKKMGLVSTQTKGKKHLFIAEDPSQLEIIVGQQEKEVEHRKEELTKILPELKTLFDLKDEKPQVRFLEGVGGLLKIQDEFLKTKDRNILGISSVDNVLKVFPKRSDYVLKRTQRNIKAKLIYTSKDGPIFPKKDEKLLLETRYIPESKFPFSSDITIYDDSIVIAALKGKISCTIIEHKEIANSFRGLFNLLWSTAEKLNNK